MIGNRRNPGRPTAAALGLLAALVPAARAHAQCASIACGSEPLIVAVGAVAALAPSDLGVVVPTAAPSLARFLLGWSWQIPLEHELRHRLVPSADLLLRGGAAWRGRLGYRYAGPHAFAGAGVALDRAAMSLSPELGVRFAHADSHPIVTDTSLHLLARADIAPESGRVRGVTVMLGWNLF